MAAANGVRRVWVGQNSLMSTPSVSCVIRDRVGADVSFISDYFCHPGHSFSIHAYCCIFLMS
jgi:phosphoglucomutase